MSALHFDPPLDTTADVYRRRIRVHENPDSPEFVVCDLEDDFHHFVVTVRHDGDAVVEVTAASFRWPWSTCPAAADPLKALAGMPLSPRFTATGAYADPHMNCTHQFDAASHAITHAAGRIAGTRAAVRQYDVEIGAHLSRGAAGPGTNRLWVDGTLALVWSIGIGQGIVDPQPPFDQAPWRGGFMRWADATLEPDAAERAIVLRRACDIGMGRGMDLDAIPIASDLLQRMSGVCYTMQPDIAVAAPRHVGSIRNFADTPEALCAE